MSSTCPRDNANCGTPRVSALSRPARAPVIAQGQACERQCPASKLQLWDLDCPLTDCTKELAGLAQPTSTALSCTATRESQWSLKSETLSLRTDGDVDDLEEELQLRQWPRGLAAPCIKCRTKHCAEHDHFHEVISQSHCRTKHCAEYEKLHEVISEIQCRTKHCAENGTFSAISHKSRCRLT